ncbi:MAG: type I 3-dehydroquinate dehydratase [Spirochaetaceae bacterium]|nr:type I 3-dehydroquinate dehydratase [Spirochaetaceae bacterium]
MAKVCLCLTGKTVWRNLQIIEKYREYIDMVELRVDCLEDSERLNIRPFPEQANLPVLLTIRRKQDGGFWQGGESARIIRFAKALAFAQADQRCNFSYIDIEEDVNVPSIEEAARAFGTRIIRSFHDFHGTDSGLTARMRSLRRFGDEIVKAAVTPANLLDVLRVWRTSRELQGVEKILVSMGYTGICTRVLAERFGSYLTFTSIKGESDFPQAGNGQLDPRELIELYHFRRLTEKTDILGITGFPLKVTDSPRIHNTIYNNEHSNAVYLPFPAESLASFLVFADEFGVRGASVTVPHKETVLPHLVYMSEDVKQIGACNTIVRGENGWYGYNTDAGGFESSILALIAGAEGETDGSHPVNPQAIQAARRAVKGKRFSIIGAGGAARAIVNVMHRLKTKALILNRTLSNAKTLASRYGFQWGGLDESGVKMALRYNDIIIQSTSAGMEGSPQSDPFPLYDFSGHEIVYDIVYKPQRTEFLKRAEKAGCKVSNGMDMLDRQAAAQHQLFFGG